MTSFSIQTFGCRVNQAEAFSWMDGLQKHGLAYEEDVFRSDIVLVNTCTLTSRADRDVRSFLRKVIRLNPEARLVVTGCYAENRFEELHRNPHVWQVYPNAEKDKMIDDVLPFIEKRDSITVKPFRSRALVKIQDGCDFNCSFCVIPSVRGRSVSVEKEKILSQIKDYIGRGFREIVLTGVHICCYGQNNRQKTSLVDLLKEIETLEGLGWVRLSSLDPRYMDQALVEYITTSRKICPHYHVSLQHGAEAVLRRMGRQIDREDCQRILCELRQRCPDASLGADIMVGFPGETQADFKNMVNFLEDSPLTYFHVFSYSPRPDTPAAHWSQVGDKVKKKRSVRLRKISAEKNRRFRHHYIGRILDGVVIKNGKESSKQGDREKMGTRILTTNYLKVSVPFCPAQEREAVKVRITGVEADTAHCTRGQVISQ